MGKAIKDKVETPTVEEIKNVEVPENAEEITEAEAEELKAKAEEQNQPIIEEPAPEEKEVIVAGDGGVHVVEKEKEEGEWLVETPNPSYTGLNVTIEFKNGKGTTKNKVVAEHFKAKGYKVTKL